MVDVGAVTGSVPDVVGMVLGLSQAMSAKEGFNCNNCVFTLTRPAEPGSAPAGQPATQPAQPPAGQPAQPPAGQPAQPPAGQAPAAQPPAPQPPASASLGAAAAAKARPPRLQPPQPAFFRVREARQVSRSFGGPRHVEAPDTVQIGLRTVLAGDQIVCAAELRHLDGWDTSIGGQMAIELIPVTVDGGVLLSVFGFADPAAAGFGRFVGSVLVKAERRWVTTTPVGTPSVTASTMRMRGLANQYGFEILLFDNIDTMDLWDRGGGR